MPIKFDNVNATYRAAVYFDSNATKSKCRLNEVIDSGCTLSTIGIVQLLESLEMTLKEFLRYYKDLSQVEFFTRNKTW